MAEFVQTMNDWRRMCKAYTTDDDSCCEGCPVVDFREHGCGAIFEMEDGTDWQRYSNAIMSWAAENPEPVYPTWGEWLESEGICFSRLTNYERIDGFSIPQVFDYQIDGKTAFICGDKVNTPIRTDMAQKLGIEPKEGA